MHFLSFISLIIATTHPKPVILCKIVEENNSSFSIIEWVPPIVVILIFVIGQFYTNKNNRKELLKTWYFKAYLDDSIRKLQEFFQEADKVMLASVKSCNGVVDSESLLELKVASNEKIGDLIRTFEFDVVEVLRLAYGDIFNSLTFELQNIQDIASNTLEIQDQRESYDYWLRESRNIKSCIIKTLAIPALTRK